MTAQKNLVASSWRPPIVTVLGHVDHGKTSLLDYIRKTSVAAREHGGITQHIGAYQVKVKDKLITFIDTPGHEAFAKMRSRGANVADIAILVVASDDSVKPQTKESIDQIKTAGIPLIVALNKIDLPSANPDKVKQDLAKVGVQVEGFGGDVPLVAVSAKTGKGIGELLEMILLVAEMKGLVLEADKPLEAVVIETRLDKGKGMVATVLVKKGNLTRGLALYAGAAPVGKIRAMFDENGKVADTAGPGKPVEVLGFTQLPQVGSVLSDRPTAPPTASSAMKSDQTDSAQLPDFLKPVAEQKQETIKIVLKADTAGSLEAIGTSLDPRVEIVGSGIGEVGEADILLAKSSRAIVIGFNVKATHAAEKLAQTEKVVFRTYKIIYELLDELSEVVSGMKKVLTGERELGLGQIIAEFPYEKQRVAGTKVANGRLARGDMVKILHDGNEIARAKIKSLRHGKDDITKADIGIECGILFDRKVDFTLGDAIIAVTTA